MGKDRGFRGMICSGNSLVSVRSTCCGLFQGPQVHRAYPGGQRDVQANVGGLMTAQEDL